MKRNILMSVALIAFTIMAVTVSSGLAEEQQLSNVEQLGKFIFFDVNLSANANQSCATCHDPGAGWTGPESDTNSAGAVYEGSIENRFGNRKPPSSAYATLSHILHPEGKEHLFIGGNFWDGRATGEKLGNPAADQAQGPFLNPLEQALGTPQPRWLKRFAVRTMVTSSGKFGEKKFVIQITWIRHTI